MALLLRATAVVMPIAGGVGVAILLVRVLPEPASLGGLLGWWATLLAASGVSVFLLERVGRRLLPLAALYRMTLVFPDRMPSRYKIARQAGRVRDLQEQVRDAREHGLDDDPTRQAETVLALITGLGDHDSRTRGHSERVRIFADMLAEELGLTDEDRERFRWAALLHDIGKLTVPEPILNKPGRPDDEEWARLQAHPSEGGRLLEPLRSWLGDWVGASVDHHERWDGSGYPRGLSGDEISLGGRVVSVCDAFEVMTAARAYKEPATVEEAREELAACAGTHFDPAVVRAFLNISVGKLKLRVGLLAWLAHLRLIRVVMALRRPVAVALASLLALMGLSAGSSAIPSPTQQHAAYALDRQPAAVAFGDGESGRRPPTVASSEPSETATGVEPSPTESVEPSPTEASTAPSEGSGADVTDLTPESDPSSEGPVPTDGATAPVEVSPTPTAQITTSSPTIATSEPTTSPSPVNGDPVAAGDTLLVQQDSGARSVDVLANDTDPDGDALEIVRHSGSGAGATVTCSTSSCTYTPPAGFHGSDTFSYTVADGRGGQDSATVTVDVNGTPVANDDSRTVNQDSGTALLSVLLNDGDPDGDGLSIAANGAAKYGTVSCSSTTCSYQPPSGFWGTDTFTYRITDGRGGTDLATVTITVNAEPIAKNDAADTYDHIDTTFNVLLNDEAPDGDTIRLVSYTQPSNGTVNCSSDGRCTWDPGDYGTTTFTYTIRESSGGLTDTATVTLRNVIG